MDADGLPDGLLHQLLASFQPPSRPTPEAVVASIPEHVIDTAADEATNGEAGSRKVNPACPVCLEDFNNGEAVAALPLCGHRFHRSECLLPWLKDHDTCPICRERIFEDASAGTSSTVLPGVVPPPAATGVSGQANGVPLAAATAAAGGDPDSQWYGDDAELEAAIAASLLDVQAPPAAVRTSAPQLGDDDLDAILSETLASPSSRASAASEFFQAHAPQPVPSESDEHFTVKLKAPDCLEFVRRYSPADTLGSLLAALSLEHGVLVPFDASGAPQVRLRCPGTPAGLLCDWSQALRSTGLPRRVMLSVENVSWHTIVTLFAL
jgi:hypothetical protein